MCPARSQALHDGQIRRLDNAVLVAMRNAGRERGLQIEGIINKPLRAASLRQILQAMMA
jgi:ribosomal protein L14